MTISAKIIADSISEQGVRLTTFELEYPRFIHAEFMTHRQFSRNAASSRAIPVKKAIELIRENTAMPIHWGKNQPGMSAKEECNEGVMDPWGIGRKLERTHAWNLARDVAIKIAEAFNLAGYHKQIVNRLLEPFSHIKVVCTATEYDNFFWLRLHPDAQPEIMELARVMWEAREASEPTELREGEWHTPYYSEGFWIPSKKGADGKIVDTDGVTLDDALAVSASCCAQVSYRKLDDSIEKARDIYKRLVDSKPVHASPFEHQGTPIGFVIDDDVYAFDLPDGVTHIAPSCMVDAPYQALWSGNFRGWIQHRQLIPENVCKNFVR